MDECYPFDMAFLDMVKFVNLLIRKLNYVKYSVTQNIKLKGVNLFGTMDIVYTVEDVASSIRFIHNTRNDVCFNSK